MSEQIIYNKRKLCFTEVSDFTDFQGVGSAPMYQRYDSVQAVLRSWIDPKYWSFLAEPLYNSTEDTIEWYVENWNEHPRRLVDLKGEMRTNYKMLMDQALQHYQQVLSRLENEDLMIMRGVLKYVSEDMAFCYDNKVVVIGWGMKYDTNKHHDFGCLIREYVPPTAPLCQVVFNPGEGGKVEGNGILNIPEGTVITADMVPPITTNQNYAFVGWDTNPIGQEITGDREFVAKYDMKAAPPIVPPPTVAPPTDPEPPKPQFYNVMFVDGGCGILNGTTQHRVPAGAPITANMIPQVKPNRKYKFTGWDVNPLNFAVQGDKVFTAQYKKKKSVWSWLWWVLLILLLLILLILLLWNCKGCKKDHPEDKADTTVVAQKPPFDSSDSSWMRNDPRTGRGGIYNPGDPYTPVPTPPEYRDILPPDQGVLPPIRDDDPIRRNPVPGEPVIRENILNVLMENEDKSILELARAFKNKYPSNDYSVEYYDDVVKRMQIKVPVNERVAMKERLPSEFAPEYKLFVFDESMFTYEYRPSDPAMSRSEYTWYLSAINAFDAWNITTGSNSVVVAVVDNGFNLSHPELKGKVVQPYNVWTHNQTIFASSVDHGTHVAGTAIASANNEAGLCGIAPNCLFMPIQVADRAGNMTTTSILDGILYALYQGADVVNVSLGSQMPGLSDYPEEFQRQLIQKNKEEERLWRKVSEIAESHKATIVAAAGNDNVLAGIDALHRPENIIVVSALDKENQRYDKADFSNYGVDYSTISAPGVDIYSCCQSGYQVMSGTSMAAPVVTGAVALMKSLNKELTTAQIVCVLQSTGKVVSDKVGPMLILDKALKKVQNNEVTDCTPEPASGDVEITLQWSNYNDLDLYCTDPAGDKLYHNCQRVASGGVYQIDMNVRPPRTNTPLEHIYWPTGGAPNGTYSVYVRFYDKHDEAQDATSFVLRIKYGDKEEIKRGTVSSTSKNSEVFKFTLNTGR